MIAAAIVLITAVVLFPTEFPREVAHRKAQVGAVGALMELLPVLRKGVTQEDDLFFMILLLDERRARPRCFTG